MRRVTCFIRLSFLERKSDIDGKFGEIPASVGDQGEVQRVHTDDGAEFVCNEIKQVCACHRIKSKLMTANSP